MLNFFNWCAIVFIAGFFIWWGFRARQSLAAFVVSVPLWAAIIAYLLSYTSIIDDAYPSLADGMGFHWKIVRALVILPALLHISHIQGMYWRIVGPWLDSRFSAQLVPSTYLMRGISLIFRLRQLAKKGSSCPPIPLGQTDFA